MKAFYIVFIALFVILVSQSGLTAERAKCEYQTGDIGTVIAYGETIIEARKKASHICFDRRMALLERRGISNVDDEQGLMTIDSCINICAN